MTEISMFLKYGLSGYLILFFDLLFCFSLIGPKKFLELMEKSGSVGLIFVAMGLPVGWLCYQLRDYVENKCCMSNRIFMNQIREWEKEICCSEKRDKELKDHTIKLIANVASISDVDCDLTGTDIKAAIKKDDRASGADPYTDAYKARTAVMFSLPVLTYTTYVIIALYWWFYLEDLEKCFIASQAHFWIAMLLPFVPVCIARRGLDRVRDEEDLYYFILIKDKENYIKALIKLFLVHDQLPARLFCQPRRKTERSIRCKLLSWIMCGPRKTRDEDKWP
ncbi:MAG: hypothetical protein KAX20_06120 [Candidatus Omnitrophica bacterium]|nr:hypothetical protein [Candidatus Omnitrophota bacterium]